MGLRPSTSAEDVWAQMQTLNIWKKQPAFVWVSAAILAFVVQQPSGVIFVARRRSQI